MSKPIHIICHDIPWPANYGGVIDCYYMIRSLHEAGIQVHLHCFQYGGRTIEPELERLCATVHCYPRRKRLSLRLPYIIASRVCPELLENLLQNDYPVLMYGLHCSWPVMDPRFAGRKMALRLINVEWRYYKGLASITRNWKRLYYWAESLLLRRYERRLGSRAPVLAISAADADYFKQQPGAGPVEYLPAFVPHADADAPGGKGGFCLYHGNLSVAENEQAATWLLNEVFGKTDVPFVIAGRNPSKHLEHLAHKYPNTCIASNPSEKEMKDLITKAQINVLPSVNDTGLKLKVLESLYRGRFCIVNDNARKGFEQNGLVITANDPKTIQDAVNTWFHRPFTDAERDERNRLLHLEFDNRRNAERIISCLW